MELCSIMEVREGISKKGHSSQYLKAWRGHTGVVRAEGDQNAK